MIDLKKLNKAIDTIQQDKKTTTFCINMPTSLRDKIVKYSKTKKVAQTQWNSGERTSMYSYFCSQGCYNDFANTYVREVIALHPRTEALETPVSIARVESTTYGGHKYLETRLFTVDNG